MEYYDIAETWSADRIREEQTRRLRAVVAQARKAPFYARILDEAGLSPEDIACPEDIRRLPFTSKDDLRAQYPDRLCCVPRADLVRMHCSSGTTGSPVAICYTRKDVEAWADLMARSMFAAGIRREDTFQNMSGYGLFTGGLGIHYGAERLGCMTIPAGAGNTRRQIKLIKDFGVTAVHILPSYALHVARQIEEEGEDPRALPLRIALVGAEPYTEETRRRIESMLDLRVYNSFGMSEMNGPGVGIECEAQSGLHIWEDAYILEIIDPETGRTLPDGEVGELVMTTLTREGMPLLRYRTHDLTRIIPGDCACGRRHRRIDRILGRSDDMFILKGVNIYPMQVEQVLMSFPEVGHNYLIRLEKQGLLETLRVLVEIREEHFVEDMRVLRGLQENIARRLRDEILVTPKVDLVQGGSLPRSEGKAQRVVDMRGTPEGGN
ncbi:MAG TPA: phenylacetate--CoA ligase [Candidatus Mailhella excrementigallinarum]|nr:MAG: phenylacetate--CoA ligase [Desulfovibrionaceae bacterium]HIV65183.1 phenylacetate--CoA ligase [Candidatus Mailhella excrementigallinarum]